MNKFLFISFLLSSLFCDVFSVRAEDAILVGAPCSALGTSTMASDQQNIVACMKNKTGALVWKSMTGGDSTPIGTVAFFVLAACPDGWALSDGTNGTMDLRGEFLRVWDGGRGVDKNRTLGSLQGDAIRNITGSLRTGYQGMPIGYIDAVSGAFTITEVAPRWSQVYGSSNTGSSASFDASKVVPVANENRPRNIALIACQKI